MPHHVEDGDNLAVSPVMLRQTVKVAVYVQDVMQVVSKIQNTDEQNMDDPAT